MERGSGSHPLPRASHLAELLECEQELEDLLAEARAQAAAIVERARAEAARAEGESEASLDQAARKIRDEIDERTRRRVAEVAREAARRTEFLGSIPDAEVARLADAVFRRLFASSETDP
ncbi:MAG: hypothetical protein OEZ65_05145 [Gemmatimonadota bacterium]|nr:hypothetical protein [Gemmatimonadota bacterium]MDH5758954.1 hypothetical protein [Gemmatimonadota bacterium]